MRISIGQHSFEIKPRDELVIRLDIDPDDETFGPCLVEVHGGTLRFVGTQEKPHGVMVRRGDDAIDKVGIEFVAPPPQGLDIRPMMNPPILVTQEMLNDAAIPEVLAACDAPVEEPKPINFREFL